MRVHCSVMVAFAVTLGPVGARAEAPPKGRTMADVLAAAVPADWRPLDPENTLYVELDAGRIVIELAPRFAPQHAANIRQLARQGYYDGLAIIRSQDNFVVQWGDPDGTRALGKARATLPAEFTTAIDPGLPFTPLPDRDGYAPEVGFSGGLPAARDPRTGEAWLAPTAKADPSGSWHTSSIAVPDLALRDQRPSSSLHATPSVEE